MKITNYHVYDLVESVVASGFPMLVNYDDDAEFQKVLELYNDRNLKKESENPDFRRACKLAANAPGTGHNNFLSGVLVAANVTATNVWWLQMERYHFVQIVSMQSKMHRLREMMKHQHRDEFFNSNASKVLTGFFKTMCAEISEVPEEALIYSCPMGLELTARITTNYLALKTIYNQRHNHKLAEWHDFCRWIETLPYADVLIMGGSEK